MDVLKSKLLYLFITISLIFSLNIPQGKCIVLPKQELKINISSFIGKWEVKTIVTESNCKEIIIGSTTESELVIKKAPINDILHFIWDGGLWSKSNGILKILTNKEAISERVTELNIDKKNKWKAELIDHLYLTDEENIIHSESIVRQYKNNELIGEYKTFSILKKSN